MAAKIISIANQKGGVGKTTLSMLFAGMLGRLQKKVLVIDTDQQGSADVWAAIAPEEVPFPATVVNLYNFGSKLHVEVQKFVADYDYIIIDCPPNSTSPIAGSALLVSDLALILLEPSPPDVWSTRHFISVIEDRQSINEDLDARIVFNKVKENTKVHKQVLATVGQLKIPVMNTYMHNRTFYQNVAGHGATVYDFGNSKEVREAITEIEDLFYECFEILFPGAKKVGNTEHG